MSNKHLAYETGRYRYWVFKFKLNKYGIGRYLFSPPSSDVPLSVFFLVIRVGRLHRDLHGLIVVLANVGRDVNCSGELNVQQPILIDKFYQ
jgi:hypothetical protein